MAEHAAKVIAHNGLSDRITVINSRIEDVTLPEKVEWDLDAILIYMLASRRIDYVLTGRHDTIGVDGHDAGV